MKRKNQNKTLSAFDKLLNEAFDDEFLAGDEEDVVDSYEDDISPIEGDEESEGGEDVTITLSADQVAVLKDVLAQLDTSGEDEEDNFEMGDESEDEEDDLSDDVSDIEELEKEGSEVYSKHGLAEDAPDAETVRNSTKKGKAADNTGELERETTKKDGEEKQYKFVKRVKPEPKKYDQKSGSKSKPDEPKY